MKLQLPLRLFFLAVLLSAAAVCAPLKVSAISSPGGSPATRRSRRLQNVQGRPSSPGVPSNILHAVDKLCSRTDYRDHCMRSLAPFLPGVTSVDPSAMLDLAIKALRSSIKSAQNAVEQASRKPGTTEQQQFDLQQCRGSFADAVDDLAYAEMAVKQRDSGTAGAMFNAISTDSTTCEEGFQEDGIPSLTYGVSRPVSMGAGICLTFFEMLHLS